MAKVRTETISGRKIDIHLDDQGRFTAELGGASGSVQSATFDGLVKAAQAKLRKASVKLDIPVLMAERNGGLVPVTLTGVHGGTGNVMFRDADGSSRQSRGWGNAEFYRRDTDAAERARLQKAMHAAQKASYDFDKTHTVSAKDLIKAALAKEGIEDDND